MRCHSHMICVDTNIHNIYTYVYVCFFCIVKSILNMISLCVGYPKVVFTAIICQWHLMAQNRDLMMKKTGANAS